MTPHVTKQTLAGTSITNFEHTDAGNMPKHLTSRDHITKL